MTRPRQSRLVFTAAWALALGGVFLAARLDPPADPGDAAVRGTARVALAFWFAAAALMTRSLSVVARWVWTLACLAFLVHVGAAFEYAHGWSHAAAYRHVEEVSGHGEGIFVSYFFTALWVADVLWWWAAPARFAGRPRWVGWAVHGFMAFVVVNATVVFESGPTRWVGLAALAVLAVLVIARPRAVVTSASPRRGAS